MSTVVRMYTGVRGLSTAIKDVGRFRAIVGILIKHGFGALVTRLGLTETLGVKHLMTYRDGDDEPYSLPQRIRMATEELGPTFVKLGQILSTRSDLLPPEIIDELQSLQDDVPPMTWADVEAEVGRSLGASPDAVFEVFEHTPLACASIAQVHRAVVREDGSAVVVKVQRTGIAHRIDADLHILEFLARRAADLIPELDLMDPVGVVAEFDRAIRKEIDFRNERENLERFAVNFAGVERVKIPRVYRTLSTERVLTMEFVEGVKITEAPAKLNVDPYEVAPRMLRALLKMVFRDGVFHGDLHPGNILIQEDGTIGLIDFGLVGRLSDAQRGRVLDILIGLSREDYALVSRTFFELGVKLPGVTYDYAAFESDVTEVMQKHLSGKTLSELDFAAYFSDLVTGAIRHRIKMPPTYTMVFKALITVQGIGQRLAPEVNLIEEAQPFVREMLAERYSPARLIRESVESLDALSGFLRQFPFTATQLLRDAEQGRLTVKVEPLGLAEAAEVHARSQQRLARSIGFGSCMIAGAMALGAPGPVVAGMSAPAFVLFALGVALGFPLLSSLLRRG